VHIPGFLVLGVLNDRGTSRIGFVLSKKHLSKATLRNRIRRLFRESFRRQLVIRRAVDLVVLAKYDAKMQKFQGEQQNDFLNNLLFLWKKIDERCERLE